jgi:hypothetical protein
MKTTGWIVRLGRHREAAPMAQSKRSIYLAALIMSLVL